MEDMTELINDIADGKMSSSEGAKEIKKWGEKGEEIQDRIKKLRDSGTTDEDFTKAGKKNEDRSRKAVKAYFEAITKLQKSGRMTKELQDAMMNVK
jgi:tryptophanyl-tRNA synthetase